MPTLANKLKLLKKTDLATLTPNLWILQREKKTDHFQYGAACVTTDASLKKKLLEVVDKAIKRANSVRDYEYLTVDLDYDAALTLSVEETDLEAIINQIRQGSSGAKVTEVNQLFDAWAYVIQLTNADGFSVLAFRKTRTGWNTKQRDKVWSAFFKDHVLTAVDDSQVFRIDKAIDFFVYDESVFILDKTFFERAMNFKAGMEKARDIVLKDLDQRSLVTDTAVIRKAIGDNTNLLRKLATVNKNGHYQKAGFIKKCKAAQKKRKWPITFDGDKIVCTDLNVSIILHLLNGDILTEPLYDEDFYVDGKHKLESA